MLNSDPIPIVKPSEPADYDKILRRITGCLECGHLSHGYKHSRELRNRIADLLEVNDPERVLVTLSGTAALRLAVVACAGMANPGDVALVPSFTYPATVEVLVQLGYNLHFVDVTPDSWTIDPYSVEKALTEVAGTRLVICVDTFGNPADYEKLSTICHRHNIPLVADSAAGFGSRYNGSPLGTQADAHAFSMSPAKLVSAGGTGGFVVLPEGAEFDSRYGWTRSQLLTELHSIIALEQLDQMGDLLEKRMLLADIYRKGLADIAEVRVQQIDPMNSSSNVHFVVGIANQRDILENYLQDHGIATRRYYQALHLSHWSQQYNLPVTEQLDAQVLALPMSSELLPEHVIKVVRALRAYFRQNQIDVSEVD